MSSVRGDVLATDRLHAPLQLAHTMKFLVDECTGPFVAEWLRKSGYEVFSVYDQIAGESDNFILQKAFSEDWILITNDKVFGEQVYRQKLPHKGIVLLRLQDERSNNKVLILERLLNMYPEKLQNQFVVVTEKNVRFAKNR